VRSAAPQAGPPGLSLPATLRLGLFQGCLGCLAVIFAGLLNRVMITELALPGLLVGVALAFEQFVSPTRIWFGQISDSRPLAGRHRLPYIWLGTLLFCGLAVLSVPLIFQVAALWRDGSGWAVAAGVAALCALFAAYGLSVSLASTPYLALVIDRTTERERPRAVGLIWCLLTVGIVVGAIAISLSLRDLDGVTDPSVLREVLLGFMGRVVLVVLALTLVATLGMEPRSNGPGVDREGSGAGSTSPRDDGPTLRQAWTLITSSRQVLVFFSFLVFFNLGLFLQDPILESYGAEVFGMPIAATASLNAYWGMGLMGGLLLAGLWMVPKWGKLGTARLGCRLIAISLVLLGLAGLTGRVPVLQTVMVLFGLAAGVGTNGALVLMLDFTLPQAAGTFVGVWGLAQALSRASGKVLGGGLLDLGRGLPLRWFGASSPAFPAYALVLGVETLMAIAALVVLSSLNPRQFRDDTDRGLDQVLALEIE
jgi:BCD family chlorophyll transporter-like MFS transporter